MSLDIKTGVSIQKNASQAVKEVVAQIKQAGTKLVVFFASSSYDGQTLAREWAAALPGVKLAGCSTAGEITPKGFLSQSLTAMSFASPNFAAGIGVGHGLNTQPQQAATEALTQASGSREDIHYRDGTPGRCAPS